MVALWFEVSSILEMGYERIQTTSAYEVVGVVGEFWALNDACPADHFPTEHPRLDLELYISNYFGA